MVNLSPLEGSKHSDQGSTDLGPLGPGPIGSQFGPIWIQARPNLGPFGPGEGNPGPRPIEPNVGPFGPGPGSGPGPRDFHKANGFC